MKIARVYLNPTAERWIDMPMPPGGMQQVWGWLATEGVLVNDVACVLRSSVHHVLSLEMQNGAAVFTVLPGGKPN